MEPAKLLQPTGHLAQDRRAWLIEQLGRRDLDAQRGGLGPAAGHGLGQRLELAQRERRREAAPRVQQHRGRLEPASQLARTRGAAPRGDAEGGLARLGWHCRKSVRGEQERRRDCGAAQHCNVRRRRPGSPPDACLGSLNVRRRRPESPLPRVSTLTVGM